MSSKAQYKTQLKKWKWKKIKKKTIEHISQEKLMKKKGAEKNNIIIFNNKLILFEKDNKEISRHMHLNNRFKNCKLIFRYKCLVSLIEEKKTCYQIQNMWSFAFFRQKTWYFCLMLFSQT